MKPPTELHGLENSTAESERTRPRYAVILSNQSFTQALYTPKIIACCSTTGGRNKSEPTKL